MLFENLLLYVFVGKLFFVGCSKRKEAGLALCDKKIQSGSVVALGRLPHAAFAKFIFTKFVLYKFFNTVLCFFVLLF